MSERAHPSALPAGDAALLVVFGEAVSPALNARVHALAAAIERQAVPGIAALVPAYASLLVHYDPLVLSFARARDLVLDLAAGCVAAPALRGRWREIPTVYGGDYGPDLPAVARIHNLTEDEVVRLHSGARYTVYMLGFSPGFAYLGGLPERLATPRLPTPRQSVPAGSVAIANQTAVYPLSTPGGWHIIGRTPLRLFDPAHDPPAYLRPGDRVRFVPIEASDE